MLHLFKSFAPLTSFRCYSSKVVSKATKPVPAKRGQFQDHSILLKRARNGLEAVASKFESWEHLFQVKREDMKELGLTPKQRKQVAALTYRFSLGIDPVRKLKHKSPAKPKKK
ncbi:hypothetical protein DSO57_1003014 [Entomophthora muscae]|uniref:Uncharacterized protein n=2 Tax=Entomophthora muscae TaxID=34485 RepID=A0ACC2SY47_9FUNG|nr:hypothetical protein DSO57_1002000 [Entomophthora muscae]KAJ9067101.1 hypothetical protein DSO57_1003014 [Entomophthora muscae]